MQSTLWRASASHDAQLASADVRSLEGGRTVNWAGGELCAGTVTLNGLPHRVWQLGAYFRIEDTDIRGVKAERVRSEVSEQAWALLDVKPALDAHAWRRHIVTPSLPQAGVDDSLHLSYECGVHKGCGLMVSLPSGTVRALGACADKGATRALDWIVRPRVLESGVVAFPFETEFVEVGYQAASDMLLGWLNMPTLTLVDGDL